MNNLNCIMQAHARVCKENKLEKQCILKQFCSYRYKFERSYRKNGEAYQDDVLKDDSP